MTSHTEKMGSLTPKGGEEDDNTEYSSTLRDTENADRGDVEEHDYFAASFSFPFLLLLPCCWCAALHLVNYDENQTFEDFQQISDRKFW